MHSCFACRIFREWLAVRKKESKKMPTKLLDIVCDIMNGDIYDVDETMAELTENERKAVKEALKAEGWFDKE